MLNFHRHSSSSGRSNFPYKSPRYVLTDTLAIYSAASFPSPRLAINQQKQEWIPPTKLPHTPWSTSPASVRVSALSTDLSTLTPPKTPQSLSKSEKVRIPCFPITLKQGGSPFSAFNVSSNQVFRSEDKITSPNEEL